MFHAADFIAYLENSIRQLIGSRFRISQMLPVSGGDIHKSYCIQGQGKEAFFIKIDAGATYPLIFVQERAGLKLLQKVGGAIVPDLLLAGQYQDDAFLLMQWIEQGVQDEVNAQAHLGRMLALMHKNTQDQFGLSYDNYLGTHVQHNTMHASWADFFIQERLQRQVERAHKQGLITAPLLHKFDRLYSRIDRLFPPERPALLHGDLWAGNYLIDTMGTPYLIDPAVYYGHREMDLALTRLFEGFSPTFYDAYEEVFPLEKNWKERSNLCNLYILLFHANVFGGSYLQQVEHILDKYV